MPKTDLDLAKPIMNAAGTLGFAPDAHGPASLEKFGAFVTNPVSLRPRSSTSAPAAIPFPGGVLLHTGLPNPGLASVIDLSARRWAASPVPIIVHLMADRPEETRTMVRRLESVDNIAAVELGFAPLLSDDLIMLSVEQGRGELPIIVNLPSEKILGLGNRVLQAGAAAISMATPRGTLPHAQEMVSGRLYGPALFPGALARVREAVAAGIPLIANGGVCSTSETDAMLAAGALAVQLDARLWLPA